jgi:UDP-glucose 4-epimerase
MKILCSGGGGFIGSHTVDYLVNRGHEVLVVDNFTTGRSENLRNFTGDICTCDITDSGALEDCFKQFKPEAVLHLAAQSAISVALQYPDADLDCNAFGTLNMLKFAKQFGVKRFVFSSTSAVYDERAGFCALREKSPCNPSTPYGISKLAAEHYIRTMFPNHLILRYANIYGPRQRPLGENQVVARAFSHFIKGDKFFVHGHGNQKRDFVHVYDIIYANFLALIGNNVGTYNAASGRSVSVNHLLSTIAENYKVGFYKWEHTDRNDPRGDVYLNASKIRNEIGWRPYISLREGIHDTAAWWECEK